jgi:endonuclease/exonuclease/phosphatase family metal-dependent hydrolase
MRLLSWNVRDLLGDPLALHRVVRAAEPDVVCLQEAPRRPGAALRLWFLERGTGLRCVAGGRRSGGTAVFVAPQVRVGWARAFRLPVTGRFTRTRGVAVADLHAPGVGEVTVASVHLPLRSAERLDHVRRVCEVLRRRGRSVVVAGDLNEPAGAPAWAAWEPCAVDPWGSGGRGSGDGGRPTYPADQPRLRIDAVLTSPGLRAHAPDDVPWRHADVARASDHLPLLAEITDDEA